MSDKSKKIIKYCLFVILAVYLMYVCFKDIKWVDFWQGLKGCTWIYVVAAMLSGLLAFFFRGLRWRMLLNTIDESLKVSTCFNATNISALVNLGIPRSGEFVRCGVVSKSSKLDENGKRLASYDKVVGTAIIDRIWDVAVLLILVLYILFGMGENFANFLSQQILSKVNISLTTIFLIVVSFVSILFIVNYYAKITFFAKVKKVFKGIGSGLASCLRIKRSWLFFVYTIFIWSLYFCMSWFILLAVKGIVPSSMPQFAEGFENLAKLGMKDALFLMIVGALSSLVPVPGGFGAFHYMIILCLDVFYGIPQGLGIIFATLSHESQVFIQALSGIISAIFESLKGQNHSGRA